MPLPILFGGLIGHGAHKARTEANTKKNFNSEMNAEKAVDILIKNKETFDKAGDLLGYEDGEIHKGDLEAIVNSPHASKEMKEAAAYLLSNQGEMNKIDAADGKVDGHIKFDNLDRMKSKFEAKRKQEAAKEQASAPKTNRGGSANSLRGKGGTSERMRNRSFKHAAQVFAKFFDILDTAAGWGVKDGIVGKADIMAALKDPSLPQELKDVLKMALESPSFMRFLDMADGKHADGKITKEGMAAGMKQLEKMDAGASSNTSKSKGSQTSSQGSSGTDSGVKKDSDYYQYKASGSASSGKFGGLSENQYDMLRGATQKVSDLQEAFEKETDPKKREEKMLKYKEAMQQQQQIFQFLMSILSHQDKMFQSFIQNLR